METDIRIHIVFTLICLVIAKTNSQTLPSPSPVFFPNQNFPARRIQLGPNTFLPRVGDLFTQQQFRGQASVGNNRNLNDQFISPVNPLTLQPNSLTSFQVPGTGRAAFTPNSGHPITNPLQANPLFNPTRGSISNLGRHNTVVAGSTPGAVAGQRTELYPPNIFTPVTSTGPLSPGQTTSLFPPQRPTSPINPGSTITSTGPLSPGQTTRLFPPQRPTSLINLGSTITGTGRHIASKQETIQAVAVMQGFGSGVVGVITFSQTLPSRIVQVSGIIQNLTPGQHGMHVHEFGDITNGCSSAGGHFNPFNRNHGDRISAIRHVGDLGNINANGGVTNFNFYDNQIQLTGTVENVIGRTIIIHAMRDDLGVVNNEGSRTTGNSGARVACGIIGIANSEPVA